MKIAITGAAGFIGSQLVEKFHSIGHEVHALSEREIENSRLYCYTVRLPSAEIYSLINNIQPDVFIHAAGKSSVPNSVLNPAADFAAGPPVVFQLLDALRVHSPESTLIFLSSAAVYGNPIVLPIKESSTPQPISPYGHHKRQSELILREFASIYGINCISARIFSAYGNGLRRQLLWDICQKAQHSEKVELMGNGKETRDFIHVNDVVEAINLLIESFPVNEPEVNICSGIPTRISDMAALISASFSHQPQVLFTGIHQPGAPDNWQGDNSWLTRKSFACKVSLDQGVKDYVKWFDSITKGAS